jgi:hypothetical protein
MIPYLQEPQHGALYIGTEVPMWHPHVVHLVHGLKRSRVTSKKQQATEPSPQGEKK